MKNVTIIGSGISGMSCAIKCAEQGMKVTLVSPFPSERAQSVMAAGGINAVMSDNDEGDSVGSHIEDTIAGGDFLAGEQAVTGLCENAEDIIRYLESIGTIFTTDPDGRLSTRAFGGQSHKRTHFCGTSTGKQIVTALIMQVRKFEAAGLIERKLSCCFHSALIKNGRCFGVILFSEATGNLEMIVSDAVVIATGGQNALFGKTTGSTQCDGYTAGKLLTQGVELKNLEFIQYHPTTIETAQKRMLISEAARGEGGRLFYREDNERIYFLEDKFGPRGNLMTRDVISREMYLSNKDIFLDMSFMDKKKIDERLPEIRDICQKYIGIDIRKEVVPVAPSVHFFMGGIAVHLNHETNINNLFAVGECASMYHGANRLGGNSLLAAMHSGRVAADEIGRRDAYCYSDEEIREIQRSFSDELARAQKMLDDMRSSESRFPVMYIRNMLAEVMNRYLGIVREEKSLAEGIDEIDVLIKMADKINYDSNVLLYFNYSLKEMLYLAKATIMCALNRHESRGAHFRSDYPDKCDEYAHASIVSYDGEEFNVRLDKEKFYES